MFPVLFSVPELGSLSGVLVLAAAALFGVGAVVLGFRRAERATLIVGALSLTLALGAAYFLSRSSVRLGALDVSTYGALLALGVASGAERLLRVAFKAGVPRPVVASFLVWVLLGGILGARLLYALTHAADLTPLEALDLSRGGLSSWGALGGGLAAGRLFLHRTKTDALTSAQILDALAPSVLLGAALVHLGSYGLGSAYGVRLAAGAPAWLRALGQFPSWQTAFDGRGAPAWVSHVDLGLLPFSAAASLPVHPVQLYSALAALLLFVALLVVRSRRAIPGELARYALFGYGALRLVVDAWRADPERLPLAAPVDARYALPLCALLLVLLWFAGPARAWSARPRSWAAGVALLAVAWAAWAGASLGAFAPSGSQACALALAVFVSWTSPRAASAPLVLAATPQPPSMEARSPEREPDPDSPASPGPG
jgi:phosphatidylglycerol:prolipoprotein diacylglycerol transferase